MPSANRTSRTAEAVCPYFRYEDTREQRVACEGIPMKSTMITRWERNSERVAFMDIFCCKEWQKCPIARAIEAFKYADED